jgi:hypothetical protein
MPLRCTRDPGPLATEKMNWMRYKGSGFTATWTRVVIGAVFAAWGLSIAVSSFRRTPTRVQADYKRLVAEAKRDGRDPASIARPPEGEMWRDGVPQWTLVGIGVAAVGVAALSEPLWRRRGSPDREEDTGQSGSRGSLTPSPHTTVHAGPHTAVH